MKIQTVFGPVPSRRLGQSLWVEVMLMQELNNGEAALRDIAAVLQTRK